MLRLPGERLRRFAVIRDVEGNVDGRSGRIALQGDTAADDVLAERGHLTERDRPIVSASDVENLPRMAIAGRQLLAKERVQVGRVKQVTHLLAVAAEPGVGQRLSEIVVSDPKREDSLIH